MLHSCCNWSAKVLESLCSYVLGTSWKCCFSGFVQNTFVLVENVLLFFDNSLLCLIYNLTIHKLNKQIFAYWSNVVCIHFAFCVERQTCLFCAEVYFRVDSSIVFVLLVTKGTDAKQHPPPPKKKKVITHITWNTNI